MQPDNPITSLKGVGETSAQRLQKLGISTIEDLLYHFPRRYEDYSKVVAIKDARPGSITVEGRIIRLHTRRTRRGRSLTKALIDDGTAAVQAIWFNQPYLERTLPKNTPIYAAGELAFAYSQYALQSPAVERVSTFPKNAARIVPVYPETEGISSKQLRYWLRQTISIQMKDPLPESIRSAHSLMDKSRAVASMHFPESMAEVGRARYRLAFEELYILFLALHHIKSESRSRDAPAIEFDREAVQTLVSQLPFSLTDSQRKSAWQIIRDMQYGRPMNRLLQGDVGSGKTVVAAIAAAVVSRNGRQTALLVPTAILAQQHFRTIQDILAPLGINVALLTGTTGKTDRREIMERLRTNDISVCVGTHALLEKKVDFADLGLVVIDEQHRFGVDQRNRLQQKASRQPHFLSMTATPIPRSLALTVYGELDISFLREMPPGREPVETYVATDESWVYTQLEDIIASGGQVYIVCPLIEESDSLGVKSVEQETKRVRRHLPNARIAGLTGQMRPAQKTEVMRQFKAGETDILVATTVVEVGVDVPNATAIVIEGAERFGLATLHQLRGRVGRGQSRAFCYLKPSDAIRSKRRLRLMEYFNDGRLLAEKDLELRGAGELYGERQHGLLDMRLVRLTDTELIRTARQAALHTPETELGPLLVRMVEEKKKQKHLN